MKTIKFNDVDLSSTYGLIYEDHVITEATPKTTYISLPYADGSLDLTEAIGGVKFNDVTIGISFGIMRGTRDFVTTEKQIKKSFLGRQVTVNLDDDEYFYQGRVLSIAFDDSQWAYLSVQMEILAGPYRLKMGKTVYEVSSTTTEQVVILKNEMMDTVPTFTTDSDLEIKHKFNQWVIGQGTYTLAIVLEEGDNEIYLKGNANVTIEYQEGAL